MVSEGIAAPTDTGHGLSVTRSGPEITLPPGQAVPRRAGVPAPERPHEQFPSQPTDRSPDQRPVVLPDAPSDRPGTDPEGRPEDLLEPLLPDGSTGGDTSGATDGDTDGASGSEPGAGEPRRHRTADLAAELFRRWTAGDAAASHDLVSLLTPTLWHTARAYRLDTATAEDVVQNAWLALARRRDQVRDPQAVLAWLLVTVRRDAARTAASLRSVVGDPEPVLAATPDPTPGPAATVLDDDRARRLWAAVGRLSERCQRLLRVVAFSDRPDYATLSGELGMPLGSIGPTRGRCLKKLRDDLGPEGGWTP